MSTEIEKQDHSFDEAHTPPLATHQPQPKMSAGRYLATRFSTLKPPMNKAENPIKLLRMLNTQQWMFFLVAFVAWSWDAFDFFTVSLTVPELAETFGKTNKDVSDLSRVGQLEHITNF
jgi:SHS family lactate transporter-like MFS transporter